MSAGPEGEIGVPVVAAVIRRGDAVLLARRPRQKRHGGLWEFPGGKVRDGESFTEALARELDEELGLLVGRVGATLFECQDPGSDFRIHFVAVEAHGAPRPTEHEAVEWVRIDELVHRPLAPSDARFAATHLE